MTRLFVALVATLALLSPSIATPAPAAEEGGASPEEVFGKMKAAADAKDWNAYFHCGSPASRPSMLGGMLMVASFATMGENFQPDPAKSQALEQLLAEHAVDTAALQGANDTDPAAAKAATVQVFAAVPDQPALFAALMGFLEAQGQGAVVHYESSELQGLAVEGTTAHATFRRGDEAKKVHFVKVDGRWYADFDKIK